jgi:hypothetical protein
VIPGCCRGDVQGENALPVTHALVPLIGAVPLNDFGNFNVVFDASMIFIANPPRPIDLLLKGRRDIMAVYRNPAA